MKTNGIEKLLDVMARLRDPVSGCAWDLEQNFRTIAPHTLEETYELVEAIESGDRHAMKDELGDVLFQVVFHAQIGADQSLFTFDDVASSVAAKMIERHPHVFADRAVKTAGDVAKNWEADKEAKREASARAEGRAPSALDGVIASLPATTHAVKLQNRAARVGFDWSETSEVLDKIREEITELEVEIAAHSQQDFLEDELGDVLFAVVNLARKLGIDPEAALRRTNRKFQRRFRGIETTLATQGRQLSDATPDEMEKIWNDIKLTEKKTG